MAEEETFSPVIYVAAGKRLTAEGFDYHLYSVDGITLGRVLVFKWTPKTMRHLITGYLYEIETGADGATLRIGSGKAKGAWPNAEERQKWAAQERAAEVQDSAAKTAQKLKKDDQKLGNLTMSQLQGIYAKAAMRSWREAAAIEATFLAILRGRL